MKESKGATINIDNSMKERIGSVLPFKLTESHARSSKSFSRICAPTRHESSGCRVTSAAARQS